MPLRRLALRLGGDLFELAALQGRQGLPGRAQFGIAEGPAMDLHTLGDRVEEFALPFGQGDAGLVGRAAGAPEGVEGRALRRLSFRLERAGGRLSAALPAAEAGSLQCQISPRADI